MESDEQNLRGKWDSKTQFLLACIGYAVGLGNIWRFPYLCYIGGGGAFLIPYFIMLIFCGVPLLYMEMAVGQLTRLGPVHAIAKLCPLLKGTGVAMVMLSFLLCTYYNVIIAWALHYLFHSFSDPLPWKFCHNEWNGPACKSDFENDTIISMDNKADIFNYETISNYDYEIGSINVTDVVFGRESPSHQYFDHFVLRVSSGIDDMGGLNGEMVGYLFLAWLICYCCIFKGVKSVGKVVYVTAIFPYIILIVLLIRGLTLPGAVNGLYYFFVPDWHRLLEPRIWIYAAAQNFNSIGIAFGSLIAFSSYNSKTNNVYHDTLAIAIINSFTSLLAGMVVFSALGGMAHSLGTTVSEAVTSGPQLVFVAIPTLFTHLPVSNLWAVLFFIMLVFLGVDSQFATVEVICTTILDLLQERLKNVRWRREIVALIICVVCFLLGLPYVSRGGIYLFTLVDTHAAVVSLMYVAYFEVMAICWLYGANRLAREIGFSSGFRPYYFFPFCWLFVSPVLITAITNFVASNTYEARYGDYVFPAWAVLLGTLVTLSSVLWIPVGFFHALCANNRGTCKQKFLRAITPTFIPDHMKKFNRRNEETVIGDDITTVHYTPAAVTQPLLIETNNPSAPEVPEVTTPPPDYRSLGDIEKSPEGP